MHTPFRTLLAAFVLLGAGCTEREGPAPGPPADNLRAAAPAEPLPPDTTVGAAHVFDPARLRAGDHFNGLEVVSVDAHRFEDSLWVGTVRFKGAITVRGRYALRDDPDRPGGGTPCFTVDSTSASLLPRFPGDERFVWFCFTNVEDARTALGTSENERTAVVVIDDYHTVRQFSDVHDTATLMRVVEAE